MLRYIINGTVVFSRDNVIVAREKIDIMRTWGLDVSLCAPVWAHDDMSGFLYIATWATIY